MVDDFKIDNPNANRNLAYTFRNGVEVAWESTENGRLYDVTTRLHYTEMSLTDNSDLVEKFVDYSVTTKLANSLSGGQGFVSTIGYDGYYRFLANNIEVNPEVIRFYVGTDITIVAAADDFATYMSVSAPATTVVQDKPHFTNIMGGDDANAGLFSSTNKAQNFAMKLADDSMDSLVRSMLTCDLQFADKIGQDTSVRSLELTTEGIFTNQPDCSYISYDSKGRFIPRESDPQLVFDKLFRSPMSSASKRKEMSSISIPRV